MVAKRNNATQTLRMHKAADDLMNLIRKKDQKFPQPEDWKQNGFTLETQGGQLCWKLGGGDEQCLLCRIQTL